MALLVTFRTEVTLGARDFSSAVSGFCQVFIGFGLRPKMCRPSAKHRKFPPHARKTSGTQGKQKYLWIDNIWRGPLLLLSSAHFLINCVQLFNCRKIINYKFRVLTKTWTSGACWGGRGGASLPIAPTSLRASVSILHCPCFDILK